MQPTPTPPPDEAATFSNFIAELNHGAIDRVITERLHEIVAACRETGSKGRLSLEVGVAPDPKGNIVMVQVKLKMTKPEPALPGAIFFTSEEGALHAEDPRQMKFPTRVIDPSGNIRRIDGGKE